MADYDNDDVYLSVNIAFQELKAAASELNAASDELGKSITQVEALLKTLNLGVSAWELIDSGGDSSAGSWWTVEVGYDKVSSKWGIAVREGSGNYNWPEEDNYEVWLFGDAPRALRVKAVGKLPELLGSLTKEATAIAEHIRSSVQSAKRVVRALDGPPAAPREK